MKFPEKRAKGKEHKELMKDTRYIKEAADRLQPLYPQMKVIYMSGYTNNAITRHGVLAPELNFLEKPFTPKGLARKVGEALGT